jgi:hypothetical protein
MFQCALIGDTGCAGDNGRCSAGGFNYSFSFSSPASFSAALTGGFNRFRSILFSFFFFSYFFDFC